MLGKQSQNLQVLLVLSLHQNGGNMANILRLFLANCDFLKVRKVSIYLDIYYATRQKYQQIYSIFFICIFSRSDIKNNFRLKKVGWRGLRAHECTCHGTSIFLGKSFCWCLVGMGRRVSRVHVDTYF